MAGQAVTPRLHTTQANPGDTMKCRYKHRSYECPAHANACTRDAFTDNQYEAQGGPMLVKSRAYRCDKGHLFKVTWTEAK